MNVDDRTPAKLRAIARTADAYLREQLLTSTEAQPARDLLTERGLAGPEIAQRFGCGYAPSDHSLLKLLRSEGFTDDEMVLASLANKSDDGRVYPYLRHRLTWTIRDERGEPIGFAGRALRDSERVKYLNTRQTPIYRKSTVLYGLDLAREEITSNDHALVVEGYTDVMAAHLAGVGTAVATCGTALTRAHVEALRGLVGGNGEVTLAFDADAAGRDAMVKAYEETRNVTSCRLTTLDGKDGLDPEEVRREHGDAALVKMVADRIPLRRAALMRTISDSPASSFEDRAVMLDRAVAVACDETDLAERVLYIRFLTSVGERSVEDIAAAFEDAPKGRPRPSEAERYDVIRAVVQSIVASVDGTILGPSPHTLYRQYIRLLAAGVVPAQAYEVLTAAGDATGISTVIAEMGIRPNSPRREEVRA